MDLPSKKALQDQKRQKARGRGTLDNPPGRFEKEGLVRADEDWAALAALDEDEARGQIETRLFADHARSIISTNDSPDIRIEASVNPYRGCEHGCVYCYARPGHEYLGLSSGLDFETKIFVKYEAASLLSDALSAKSWTPKPITFSGVTDCYQPIEKKLGITRACLEVLRDFKNPVSIITKNYLVTRDIDILADMARDNLAHVGISVTTLDSDLSRRMEPRASQPRLRLRAITELAAAGIPAGIMIGPVIPGLTDHEIPAILKAGAQAGARHAHYTMLRLPHGVKDHFQTWLDEHFPDRAGRVLAHVRDMRGGKLYDSSYTTRMRGEGPYAEQIAAMMNLYKKRYGLNNIWPPLCVDQFRRDARAAQLSLF